MHAIIIDDEKSGREALKALLKTHCPEIKVDYLATNAEDGRRAINSYNPDLVFLDIEMPRENGFDFLRSVQEVDFEVIFVTAYDKYALHAIKASACDYLLKPLDEAELINAVAKAVKKISLGAGHAGQYEALFNNLGSKSSIKKLVVPDTSGYMFFPLEKITRVESIYNQSYLFQDDGSKTKVNKLMKYFEEHLPEEFCRVHQSHIINLRHVKKFIKGDGGVIIMNDGTEIDVSRRKKDEVLDRMSRV